MAIAACNRWELLCLMPLDRPAIRQQRMCMSTDSKTPAEEEEEEVPIPGVGKWKTSTGIVCSYFYLIGVL